MWCGGGTILHVSGDGGHPVKAAIDGLEVYSYSYGGRYWCKGREDNYDLVGFVDEPLSITEADVGKLFKTREGGVQKVIYVHPVEDIYPRPVVAINTYTGRAFNFQLNGWFLRSEASEYDLVERYEPLSWEKFCKNILKWSTDRGIIANSTAKAQALKGLTEFGKLVEAYLNKDRDALLVAVGNIAVHLVSVSYIAGENPLKRDNAAELEDISAEVGVAGLGARLSVLVTSTYHGYIEQTRASLLKLPKALDLDLNDCLEAAWNSIKDRRGYLNEQGVFVKES